MKIKLHSLLVGVSILFALTESNAQTSTIPWTASGAITFTNPLANNLGIGLFAPSEKLHIVSGGNIFIDAPNGIGPYGGLLIGGKSDLSQYGAKIFYNNATSTSVRGLYINSKSDGSGIVFRVDNSNGTTERMRITNTGVGVGTGSFGPWAPLQVNGNIIIGSTTPGLKWMFETRSVFSGDYFGIFPDDVSGNMITTKGLALQRSSGNIGIGTVSPEDKLQVGTTFSKVVMGSAAGLNIGYGTSYIGFNASRQTGSTWSTSTDYANNGGAVIYSTIFGDIRFSSIPTTGTTNQTGITDVTILNSTKLLINKDGNVGIGVIDIYNPAFKLTVCGGVHAKKLVIETGWCDFVFDKNYELMSIEILKEYIKTNKHLPNIPTASEVETNGGDIGELVKLQMQKIEELSLYVIQLKEENEKIKESIQKLNK